MMIKLVGYCCWVFVFVDLTVFEFLLGLIVWFGQDCVLWVVLVHCLGDVCVDCCLRACTMVFIDDLFVFWWEFWCRIVVALFSIVGLVWFRVLFVLYTLVFWGCQLFPLDLVSFGCCDLFGLLLTIGVFRFVACLFATPVCGFVCVCDLFAVGGYFVGCFDWCCTCSFVTCLIWFGLITLCASFIWVFEFGYLLVVYVHSCLIRLYFRFECVCYDVVVVCSFGMALFLGFVVLLSLNCVVGM